MALRLTDRDRRGRTVTLVLAAVALDLLLFSTLLNTGAPGGRSDALVLGYAMVGGALLYWQRRSAVPGYAALWTHAMGSMVVVGYRPTLLLLVGLYAVAAAAPGRVAWGALVAALGPIGLAVADGVREAPPGEGLATFTGLTTLLILVHCGVWALGRWARRVRARDRDRAAAAQDAVEVERARIAGELHDIVGHSVTLMTLQAAGARKVMRQDPNRADAALAQVGGAGAQAMSELRGMLSGLRPGALSSARRLDDLLDRIRATGVTVTVVEAGSPGRLESTVDAVAYRIVQEALTNVVKHAGPGTRVTVALGWASDRVTVEVTDDGCGRPTDAAAGLSTGHGLWALTARVADLGGRLESGPKPEGGFGVRATLPTEKTESESTVARPAG